MIKFVKGDEYIYLSRRRLRLVRKYVLKVSKSFIAALSNVCEKTVSKMESTTDRVRPTTFEKIFMAFVRILKYRGWKPVPPVLPEAFPNV